MKRQEYRKTWKDNINITEKDGQDGENQSMEDSEEQESTHHHTHTPHKPIPRRAGVHTPCIQIACCDVVTRPGRAGGRPGLGAGQGAPTGGRPVLGWYPHHVHRTLVWTLIFGTESLTDCGYMIGSDRIKP